MLVSLKVPSGSLSLCFFSNGRKGRREGGGESDFLLSSLIHVMEYHINLTIFFS